MLEITPRRSRSDSVGAVSCLRTLPAHQPSGRLERCGARASAGTNPTARVCSGQRRASRRGVAASPCHRSSARLRTHANATELQNGPPVPPAPPRRRRRGPQRERLDGDGQALALRDARGAPRPRRQEVKGLVDGGGVAVVAVAVSFHGDARAHAATINGTGRRRGGPRFSPNKLGAAQFASGAHPAARAAAATARNAEGATTAAAEGAAGAPLDGPFAAQPRLVTRYLYAVCLTL